MRRTLRIDGAACSGAGTCAAMHPHLFEVGDGCAVPLQTVLDDPADIASALDAAEVCPTEAIELTEPEPDAEPEFAPDTRPPAPH